MTQLRLLSSDPTPSPALVRARPRAIPAPASRGRAPAFRRAPIARRAPTSPPAPRGAIRLAAAPLPWSHARRSEFAEGLREVFVVVMATLALGLVSAAIDAGRMSSELAQSSGGRALVDGR